MTRDEMISLLVLDRLEYRDDHARYVRGFRKLSDKELAAEIRELGLNGGPKDDIADDVDDGLDAFADDDHLFDSSLVVGHAINLKQSGDYSQ
jgi:hypothetical protein